MKLQMVVLICGVIALASARPADDDIVDFETNHMSVEQEGQAGHSVTGEYSWVAPNGQEFKVEYIADHLGFRVVETDAVAVTGDSGLPADVRGDDSVEVEDEEDDDEEDEDDD